MNTILKKAQLLSGSLFFFRTQFRAKIAERRRQVHVTHSSTAILIGNGFIFENPLEGFSPFGPDLFSSESPSAFRAGGDA